MRRHGKGRHPHPLIKLIDQEHWLLRRDGGYPDSAARVKIIDSDVDITNEAAAETLQRYFSDVEQVDVQLHSGAVYVIVEKKPHGLVRRRFVAGIISALRGTVPHV